MLICLIYTLTYAFHCTNNDNSSNLFEITAKVKTFSSVTCEKLFTLLD